jgi:hypothetical protein
MREVSNDYTEPSTDPIPPYVEDAGPGPVRGPADAGNNAGNAGDARDSGDAGAVLFGGADSERFRAQWRELQAEFVDDPMTAVKGADELVGEVLRALSETFAAHKHELEAQWQGGGAGETEELRVAMRRYRSFLDQLLHA